MNPAASVVVPTYNRASHLRRLLDALERQTTDASFEVVVVDDGSTDDTQTVLAGRHSFALKHFLQPNRGPAAARNLAIRQATGELVIFADDDVIPAADFVERHIEAQASGAGVMIGRMARPTSLRQPVWAEWETRALERQYQEMRDGVFSPTARQFYTANASVPRRAVERAGMFNETFRRAEDVELAYRLDDLGLPFRFLDDAVVIHDTPRPMAGWLRMAAQYGRYDVIMWRDLGRRHIIDNMAYEFAGRHASVRRAARMSAGRRGAAHALRATAPTLIRALDAARLRRAALAACSLTFNLLYLDAASREYGGAAPFWNALGASRGAALAAAAVRGG